jgi:hypothetical protein
MDDNIALAGNAVKICLERSYECYRSKIVDFFRFGKG